MPYWSVYFFSPLSFSTLLKTRYHNSHAKMGTLERGGLSASTTTMKAYNTFLIDLCLPVQFYLKSFKYLLY